MIDPCVQTLQALKTHVICAGSSGSRDTSPGRDESSLSPSGQAGTEEGVKRCKPEGSQEALKAKASDAMKAMELKLLQGLQGGGFKSNRGTPMAASRCKAV